MPDWDYHSPAWLPGGQLQTIFPALCARPSLDVRADVVLQRQRWPTPDGDFVDVDLHLQPEASGSEPPVLLCLFHGLEGSSRSHYARAFAHWARREGLDFALPHFRGCSGDINLAPRAYHSGDHGEIGWILSQIRLRLPEHIVVAAGVSLGGNALLRWAGERGEAAGAWVRSVAGICAPIDLTASGHAIGAGFNAWVYTPMFLRTMKRKAEHKWMQFPGLFDLQCVRSSRTLYEFDDAFTAPLHGFDGVQDYWRRASAKPVLADIRVPALLLNALNDPFVPMACLPRHVPGDWVQLWQPPDGGHVGFAAGAFPGHLQAMPQAVGGWLLQASGLRRRSSARVEASKSDSS